MCNTRSLMFVVALAVSICVVWSAKDHPVPAENCKGMKTEDLLERVKVEPKCGKNRCKFRKGTNATISLQFKPDYEVKTLTIDVFGIVSELSLPFIGVTGSSACGQVTRVETGEPADCPLAPDVEYAYTKSFPIETFYPSLSVRVHWALVGDKGNVICFEVPAVIK